MTDFTQTIDSLIDSFSTSRVYIPAIFVVNKIDTVSSTRQLLPNTLFISAEKGTGLEVPISIRVKDKI